MCPSSEPSLPMFQDQLGPRIDCIFAPLCTAIPLTDIPGLRDTVRLYVQEVRHGLRSNEFLDIETVSRIADVICILLDSLAPSPVANRTVVVSNPTLRRAGHISQASNALIIDVKIENLRY